MEREGQREEGRIKERIERIEGGRKGGREWQSVKDCSEEREWRYREKKWNGGKKWRNEK